MAFEQIAKDYAEARKVLTERVRESIVPAMVDAMKEDGVTGVQWRQYTPYFNDGDTCEFSVYATYGCDYRVGGKWITEDGEDEDGNVVENWDSDKCKNTCKVLGSIPEDAMLDMFGDHCEVTATLKGESVDFEVEEYEHD